ncbi:MAG: hypothetical protein WCI72_06340 [archaeon]
MTKQRICPLGKLENGIFSCDLCNVVDYTSGNPQTCHFKQITYLCPKDAYPQKEDKEESQ